MSAQPQYTVWLVSSPMTGERRLIVRLYQVDDLHYEHPFQRIMFRGPAQNRQDALNRARIPRVTP